MIPFVSDSHCSDSNDDPPQQHNDPANEPTPSWGDNHEHDTSIPHLRIATLNINGLPKESRHVKNSSLREAIASHHLDIIGLSEINIKWDRVYPSNRLKQRAAKWWETCHCSYAYNYQDLSKVTYQPGGTALITLHSTTHRIRPPSLSDSFGLGRWTSTLYSGKQGINLRIIQVYCPPPPSPLSHNSTYTQQHRHFLNMKISECPRTLFFQHLSTFLHERHQAQEQIILMGDFNHIVDSPQVLSFLEQHHLHNIHHTLHTSFHSHIPTYERGTRTIDAIFASLTITASKGGFLPFKTFPSDHRLIWCDIQFDSLFGAPKLNIVPHSRRRLQCEDPRIVKKFCDTYLTLLRSHGLLHAAHTLSLSIHGPLSPSQKHEFERIDSLRIKFMLQAEKNVGSSEQAESNFRPKSNTKGIG